MDTPGTMETYDVVVLGGGYAGVMAALRLARPKWRLRIALVNAHDHFLERVRLQETIVTTIERLLSPEPGSNSFTAKLFRLTPNSGWSAAVVSTF